MNAKGTATNAKWHRADLALARALVTKLRADASGFWNVSSIDETIDELVEALGGSA
jgi:hypothetical protein